MATYRVHKTKDYTVMSNAHLREKQMSLKAKGLLSLMLSLPDDWDYSIAGLMTLSKDGKDSVMATLNELEAFRYLRRTKLTDEKGRFAGYDYDIYEKPIAENPQAVNPYAENPNTENPPQINTKPPITKKTTTNKEIYIVILDYLNSKAGTNYKPGSKATQQHINARLAEGYKVDDFKAVIDKKCAEWLGSEWEKYLRPSTLFGSKFEQYLNGKQQSRGRNGIAVNSNPSDLAGVF